MAGFLKITIDTSGATAKIAALERRARNLAPVYRLIGNALVNRIRLCFRMGVDPWGSPWARLKIRKGQPLKKTGHLMRSITSKPDATGVTVGTNLRANGVSYPAVHQFGASIKPKKGKFLVFQGSSGRPVFARGVVIPRRSFMPIRANSNRVDLPPTWRDSILAQLQTYLQIQGP